MCGRFALTLPTDAMAELFGAEISALPDMQPRYNICPTQSIVVVTSANGTRTATLMRWGFTPHWYKSFTDGPLLINARAETVADKPAFRGAVRERRCLIPASGFYEWTKTADGKRLPWYIQPTTNSPLAFAGIWQDWQAGGQDPVSTCAIVTCAANETLAPIHHRMPVIIAAADHALWLGEADDKAAPLMRPAPDSLLRVHRVSPRVNGTRENDTSLTTPLTEN